MSSSSSSSSSQQRQQQQQQQQQQAPPFPWRKDDSAAPGSSDLLRRVKDFLPQIQAANQATTSDVRIDEGLIVDGKEDNDDGDHDNAVDDKQSAPVAKKQRTDTNPRDDTAVETTPTIQLDLTLGVDANHPAMALLGKTNAEDGDDKKVQDETPSPGSKAERAVQSLLNQPKGLTRAAKGPLITEVPEE